MFKKVIGYITMGYFDIRENVDGYNKMVEGFDNSFIVGEVEKVLPKNSSLLELGMGPGLDLISLSNSYNVLGSDSSKLFVEDFCKKRDIKAIVLDAVSVEVEGKFDCIFSNKVLQHLSVEDFVISLENQYKHLNRNGIVFMTLWRGEPREEFEQDGQLRFVYYDLEYLKNIIPNVFDLHQVKYYQEFEKDDSMIVILKVK